LGRLGCSSSLSPREKAIEEKKPKNQGRKSSQELLRVFQKKSPRLEKKDLVQGRGSLGGRGWCESGGERGRD